MTGNLYILWCFHLWLWGKWFRGISLKAPHQRDILRSERLACGDQIYLSAISPVTLTLQMCGFCSGLGFLGIPPCGPSKKSWTFPEWILPLELCIRSPDSNVLIHSSQWHNSVYVHFDYMWALIPSCSNETVTQFVGLVAIFRRVDNRGRMINNFCSVWYHAKCWQNGNSVLSDSGGLCCERGGGGIPDQHPRNWWQ